MCRCVIGAIFFLLVVLTVDLWMEPIGQCDRKAWFYFLNDACLLEQFSLVRTVKRRLALMTQGDVIYLNHELVKLSRQSHEIVEQCRKIIIDLGKNTSICSTLKYEMDVWLLSAQMFIEPGATMRQFE